MISIVITAFKEPMLYRAIDAVLFQRIDEDYELIVAAPDRETEDLVNDYKKKYRQIRFFKDPGKGKSYALNMIFKELKGDVWLFTDGDVFLDNKAINEMLKLFNNYPRIGCIAGRVYCENPRTTLFGYWGKLLADCGAHRIRKEHYSQGKFLECSGYLFAFRNNGVIKEIPVDVAEDSIIPYYFWKAGYKIGYAPDSRVFVKNPTTMKDWLKQRKRTADAHTKLTHYATDFPKVKSFRNEALKGIFWIWSYPKSFKEFVWTVELVFVRLYMWLSLYFDLHFKKKQYVDGWNRSESTKN